VETLTYVPVISICQFLASRDLLGEITRATEGQLVSAGASIPLRGKAHALSQIADLDTGLALLNEVLETKKPGQKEVQAKKRAESGILLLKSILGGAFLGESTTHFRALFGESEFANTCKRLVTNAYRTDIHFLPADGQDLSWSAIRSHSVALFRYPLTLPLELLDLSIATSEGEWDNVLGMNIRQFPCASSLLGQRPIKLLRIRPRFISDLLTRFISLYGRLGSPDFSPGTIETYVQKIMGEEQ
jgi:hypothetical protein